MLCLLGIFQSLWCLPLVYFSLYVSWTEFSHAWATLRFRVIFGPSILGSGYIRVGYTRFGLYSGRVYSVQVNSGRFEAGRNRICFRTSRIWVGFGLSIFGSLRVGFTLGRVISGVGHFGCGSISGFVRLSIDLRWVFGSKSVQPISGVGSGMDPGQSVRVSGFGSVLPGLDANKSARVCNVRSQCWLFGLGSSNADLWSGLHNCPCIFTPPLGRAAWVYSFEA